MLLFLFKYPVFKLFKGIFKLNVCPNFEMICSIFGNVFDVSLDLYNYIEERTVHILFFHTQIGISFHGN